MRGALKIIEQNIIRAIIFFVAGLAVLIVPREKLYNFQAFVLDKLHIKNDEKKRNQVYSMYPWLGVTFIIISLCLFMFSLFS